MNAENNNGFTIIHGREFGILRYHSSHIPVSIPKIYTEESIIENCMKLWPDFLKAENYIAEHKELLDYETANLQNKLVFYKNQLAALAKEKGEVLTSLF